MADILDDLKAVRRNNGHTYSSYEVLGMVGRAIEEIAQLRAGKGSEQDRIEAAAKALAECNDEPFDEVSRNKYLGDARAALTAAGRVAGEPSPTVAEYLAEVILDHIEGEDAGSRAHSAALAVIDYLQSLESSVVRAALAGESEWIRSADGKDTIRENSDAVIRRLMAENAQLRAVLEPFAKAADLYDGMSDRPLKDEWNGNLRLMLSDLRQARAALAAAGRVGRPLDYVPIVGPGVDAHEARKEQGATTDQEPVANARAAGRVAGEDVQRVLSYLDARRVDDLERGFVGSGYMASKPDPEALACAEIVRALALSPGKVSEDS